MKRVIACCLMTAFTSIGCHSDDKTNAVASAGTDQAKALALAGTYKGGGLSMVFEKGKCFCVSEDGKDRAETAYLIKEDKVYIAPIVPKGEKMIRNVWVAYTIKEGMLESRHVEDMVTGDVFYKDKQPRIILTKE